MTEQNDLVEELEASAKLYDNAGLDGEFGANLMRTAKAEITRLQADNQKLREYAVEVTKALTGMTVGGSEFFLGRKRFGFYEADILGCTENIKWRVVAARKYGEARGKAAMRTELDATKDKLAKAVEALERLNRRSDALETFDIVIHEVVNTTLAEIKGE